MNTISESNNWPKFTDSKDLHPIIKNGIPRYINVEKNYSDAFGIQWKKYRLTQLDSYTGCPLSETRLKRCLGNDLSNNLKNKLVLEAGCGAGRFTEILLKLGARVVSIDMSDAVEANQENFPQNDSHRILQADIMKLPLEKNQFDVVLCLGVVQHTPSPEKTIQSLFEYVKPGGYLVFDHYTSRLKKYTKISSFLLRPILKRLPRNIGIKSTEVLTSVFLPVHKMLRKYRLLQMLFSRISPVVSYYHVYPELSDDVLREWAILDTHDSLTDWYKHLRNKKQIEEFTKTLNVDDMYCEYGGNGVEFRARKIC